MCERIIYRSILELEDTPVYLVKLKKLKLRRGTLTIGMTALGTNFL